MTAEHSERTRSLNVRTLFADTHPHRCTGKDVLRFYGWLEVHRRDLLPAATGDTYQKLKSDLTGLYED